MSGHFWYLHRPLPVLLEVLCVLHLFIATAASSLKNATLPVEQALLFFQAALTAWWACWFQGFLVALWPNMGLHGRDGDRPPKTALGKKSAKRSPYPHFRAKWRSSEIGKFSWMQSLWTWSPQTPTRDKGGIMGFWMLLTACSTFCGFVLYAMVCHFSIFSKLLLLFSC